MLCLLLILFCGCYKPTYEEKNTEDTSTIDTVNIDYEDDDANINWGYGCKLNGVVYVLNNREIRYIEDGKLKYICRDPLCNHVDNNCASYRVVSIDYVTTDGSKLYCLGHHIVENPNYKKDIEAGRKPDKPEFTMNDGIFEIDVESQKTKMLIDWEETGISTPMVRINGDYVYYLIISSEEKSGLYRINKNGGNAELVSNKEDISNIIFSEKTILYRSGNLYYITDRNFKESKLFTDKILSFVTFKDGYVYYATADVKSFNCINSDKKITLNNADIYRIRIEDVNNIEKSENLLSDVSIPDGFIITDTKIVYLPNEPVYIGKTTITGADGLVDLYNYSNGKVMVLDLNTLEKKIICTEVPDGFSYICYADDNQVFISNTKIYHIDINTGKINELIMET